MNSDILFEDNNFGSLGPGLGGNMASMLGEYPRDRYSRKVFVGGLPPDIDEGKHKMNNSCNIHLLLVEILSLVRFDVKLSGLPPNS